MKLPSGWSRCTITSSPSHMMSQMLFYQSWSQTQTNPSVDHYQYQTILGATYCIAGLFDVRNFHELCVLSQWMKGSESTLASFPGSLLLCLRTECGNEASDYFITNNISRKTWSCIFPPGPLSQELNITLFKSSAPFSLQGVAACQMPIPPQPVS